MAQAPSENQPPTEELQNLVFDEETGERVSKTEKKRRDKHRATAAKKAEKAGSASTSQPANKRKQEEESQLNPNQYYELRCERVKRQRTDGDSTPYPNEVEVTTDMSNFNTQYEHLKTGDEKRDVEIRAGGRILNKRESGANLRFYEVDFDNTKIQVMCQSNNAIDKENFVKQHEDIHRGDIICVYGFPGRTSPRNRDVGELSVFAYEVTRLTPCLKMLPSEHFGLKDQEQRFRERELDLIINMRSRKVLRIRSQVINSVRMYLLERNFEEVETPMMNQVAGGATAKPFKTFHNAYKEDLYMRVAPELYLKRLVVGGIPRVFEIGKQFRNEDADLTHNPEFTTCEFYRAYADVYKVMDMTEEMVEEMVKKVNNGSLQTTYHTQTGEELKINWAKPWKRVEMIPALEEACKTKFPPADQLHTDESNQFLRSLIAKMNVDCPPPQTNARMIDKLVGEFIEENCINPTFITGHPQMMSPLAKGHRSIPGLCERSEAFVCRKEIANMYTELNDPFEQRKRFEEQARQKAQGDEEAQEIDEEFVKALDWGLPPTGGWGMGIDRMAMFLTDNYSIREVLAFPFMKRE